MKPVFLKPRGAAELVPWDEIAVDAPELGPQTALDDAQFVAIDVETTGNAPFLVLELGADLPIDSVERCPGWCLVVAAACLPCKVAQVFGQERPASGCSPRSQNRSVIASTTRSAACRLVLSAQ